MSIYVCFSHLSCHHPPSWFPLSNPRQRVHGPLLDDRYPWHHLWWSRSGWLHRSSWRWRCCRSHRSQVARTTGLGDPNAVSWFGWLRKWWSLPWTSPQSYRGAQSLALTRDGGLPLSRQLWRRWQCSSPWGRRCERWKRQQCRYLGLLVSP